MFNKNIKMILAGIVMGLAVYQFIEGYIGNGIALIFLGFDFRFFSISEMKSFFWPFFV